MDWFTVSVRFPASDEAEASAFRDALRGFVRSGKHNIGYACTSLSCDAGKPDPVDAHGKHGVADGHGGGSSFVLQPGQCLDNVGMVDLGPAPIHQPEERPAACACYMGATAQPFAHEPSCPVHPRYADTQLLEFGGEVQDVSIPRLDHAKQDGQGKDA